MIPENEQGVIVLFAQQAEAAGFEILNIRTEFPDAKIRKGSITYRAEFELVASNFKTHKHDVRDCDIIICWENDLRDGILPVLALAANDWQDTDLTMPSNIERDLYYWKDRALVAETKLDIAQTQLGNLLRLPLIEDIEDAPKQDRILIIHKKWPNLPQRSIAILADSSPAYVSEVLSAESNGTGE